MMTLEEFELFKEWVDRKVRLMLEINKLNPYDVHRCTHLAEQLELNDKIIEDYLKRQRESRQMGSQLAYTQS